MTSASNPMPYKTRFLQENQLFSEIELTNESKSIGRLDDIDLVENEVWLLQCPKDMNIAELQNQKLKLPGRSNVNSSEAISMEFDGSKERHAFAYCSKKGCYVLSLLPVSGTIVLRDRLKAAEEITAERALECAPSVKKVPMPKSLRIRHPLLGINFEDKVKLDKTIEERLRNADEKAVQMLKQSLNRKTRKKSEVGFKKISDEAAKMNPPIEINSDDDTVEFVSEEKLNKKRKKSKRKQSERNEKTNSDKAKKLDLNAKEHISKDLQWLQTI